MNGTMVDVELVEAVGKGEIRLPVSDAGSVDIMPRNAMQQLKKYNNIGQHHSKQRNTSQGNNYYIQEFYKMIPAVTSQPAGLLVKYTSCTTRLILRLDMGAVFQWNGYYWTTNPPLMSSLIIGSSKISGRLANI